MFYLRYRQDIFRLTIEYPTISSQSQNPEKIGWVHRYHRGRFRGNLEEGAMLHAEHSIPRGMSPGHVRGSVGSMGCCTKKNSAKG